MYSTNDNNYPPASLGSTHDTGGKIPQVIHENANVGSKHIIMHKITISKCVNNDFFGLSFYIGRQVWEGAADIFSS